jgi:hypothetical protein
MFSLLSLMALDGCATYHVVRWESPPEGQHQIKVGTPRSIVEQIHGEPLAEDGPVHSYEYSTKDRPDLATGMVLDVISMGLLATRWDDMERVYQAQRTRRQIAYGPDGRVISLSPQSANVWYKVGELNGFKDSVGSRYRKTATGYKCCYTFKNRRELLAEQLDSAELSEAERLAAQWQLNPAECDEISAHADN